MFSAIALALKSPVLAARIARGPARALSFSKMSLLLMVTDAFLALVVAGAITVGVVRFSATEHVRFAEMLARAIFRLPRIFLIYLITALSSLLVLLPISGVLYLLVNRSSNAAQMNTFSWSAWVILPLVCIFIRLVLTARLPAIPAAVAESRTASSALRRSRELTEGHHLKLTLAFTSYATLAFLLNSIFDAYGTRLLGSRGIWPVAYQSLVEVFEILLGGIGSTMLAVAYYDLRLLSDGERPELVANVFA